MSSSRNGASEAAITPADEVAISPADRASIIVVGIGADGWPGVPERLRRLILAAPVVLGGRRHLAMLPPVPGQRREAWPSPLRAGLPELLAGLDPPVLALASGDPLVAGIGATLLELCPPGTVRIEPAVSSVALARARMGWPAETCVVVNLVGRDPALLRRQLAPGRRVLVLCSDATTPGVVAGLLVGAGYGASRLTVLGDLAAETESRVETTASGWAANPPTDVPRLAIVALDLDGPARGGWLGGLPDDAFEHDGQLTKRDLRASALARLAPVPGEHLWDVGAGAGSVAIEWLRADPTCTATAIEADPVRVARIARNAAALGVPGLTVVTGRAPAALAGLPTPQAIFVGGGASSPGVLEDCLAALPTGGRLVVHGVTLETEQHLAAAHAAHGGELVRIAVETAAPIGRYTGWTPARTVTQWALEK